MELHVSVSLRHPSLQHEIQSDDGLHFFYCSLMVA